MHGAVSIMAAVGCGEYLMDLGGAPFMPPEQSPSALAEEPPIVSPDVSSMRLQELLDGSNPELEDAIDMLVGQLSGTPEVTLAWQNFMPTPTTSDEPNSIS